jgi:hypothetical protein
MQAFNCHYKEMRDYRANGPMPHVISDEATILIGRRADNGGGAVCLKL